ncbi:MAG: glycosyltransferase family 9 protein [Chloroflexota bacterium]
MTESKPTLLHQLFGDSPRILILRGARLGDYLSTTPALRALRRALPRATIGLITAPDLAPFARRYSWFDEVFVAPAWPGVSDGPEGADIADQFFAMMRAWRADVAFQLNGGGENSNPFVLRLGARLTVGVRHPSAPDLDLTIPYSRTQPVRVRFLDLLALLGIPPVSLDLELPARPEDDVELAAALPAGLGLAELDRTPLLGIHAGARSGARQWPIERFAEVGHRLADEFRFRPLLLGSEAELGRGVAVALRTRAAPIDLTGRTSLGALVAAMRRLDLFLGNDSGPSHVAEAVGTPSVTIYGASHPINWAPTSQAWHRAVADWTAPCRWFRPCGCPDDSTAPCLQAVTVDQVLSEARSLIAAVRRGRCLRRLGA